MSLEGLSLDDLLARSLPRPPARLLVLGTGSTGAAAAGLEARLEAAGYALVREAADEGPFGACVLVFDGPLDGSLENLTTALGAEGRLVALARSSGVRALEAELPERGFVIRKRAEVGGHRVLVARRDPFIVRPLEDGEENQVLDLFERSFHTRRSPGHWRWQYRGNPLGGPRVSAAFDGDGEIVAHYAGYPVAFHDPGAGRRVLGHQIGDTMTVPRCRHVGRGPTSLLARSALHFYARFCAGSVSFNYGFNVGNIQKFSMRFLRARRVEPVPFWRLEVGVAKPLPEGGRRTRAPGWHVQAVEEPTEEWDDFFRRAAAGYGLLVERTAEHLRWRYLERPGFDYLLLGCWRRYELVGWAVFRREGDRLLWGDALLDPSRPEAARHLLEAALASPTGRGAASVEGWFAPRPAWLGDVFEGLGFARLRQPDDLALMCVPFEEPDPSERLARDLYYTLGDGDLF